MNHLKKVEKLVKKQPVPSSSGSPGEVNPCLSETKKSNLTQEVEPANVTFLEKVKYHLKQNLILVLTLGGIMGGIFVGFLGRNYELSSEAKALISFPGEILLRILKMLILPLIISSLITGLAQLDPKSSGKMGSRALLFYVLSTVVACVTGIIMALIVHPGKDKILTVKEAIDREPITTFDAMLDIIRNMFPENIVQACSQQLSTSYKRTKKLKTVVNQLTKIANSSIATKLASSQSQVTAATEKVYEEVLVRELKYIDGTNVMGLVIFCTIFGIFISHSKSEAQILYDFFFFVMNELIMKIVGVIMWYSPVGILFLVASNIIKIDNMADTAKRLSLYMITVILGLMFHGLVSMQVVYFLITRKNPLIFLKGMLQAWLTAVGTASSSATLPITFRCLEENNKVDRRVTRFMLPLGATINMDGTALYQSVATLFIAQLNGVEFGLGQLVAVCMASTATSIGVASVPSAALVTMLIVLSTVGLPTEHVSYIIAVDWLLDRLRTSINVLGDAYGCGIVAHLSRLELKKLDEDAEIEFAKMITANEVTQNQALNEEAHLNNPIITICDEINTNALIQNSNSISQQLNDFRKFEAHKSSLNSIANNEQSKGNNATQVLQNVQAPSLVAMDAYKRRARNLLLFSSSKLPPSVFSMPHLSQIANSNQNGGNQDSNV